MSRRTSIVAVLSAAAVAVALGGLLFAPGGAGAGGPGHRPGMGDGYGPGMMGRQHRSGSSDAARRRARLVIRHQYAHCHTWSLNGGPFRAKQSVTLARGGRLKVIDDDVMPHRLVKLAGPRVRMHNGTAMPMMSGYASQRPGLMNHMGAWTTVRFSKPGVYRFRTRAGEDYMPGIRTGGADNVLTLKVRIR